MSEERNPEVLKQWLDANSDKVGTPDYDTVKMGYDRMTRIAGYKQELQTANPAERAGIMADYLLNVGKDFVKAAGIKGGPAAIGQVLGGVAGERVAGKAGRKIGERVGGGLGAGIGSLTYQNMRGDVRGGELATDIISGAMQTKGMTTSAITGTALDIVRQAIDEKSVNLKEASAAGLGAATGAKVANMLAGSAVSPEDALMAGRIKAFEDVRPYGVVVNPAELATEMSTVQRLAGPQATSAKASHINQSAWQKMAFEQAEIPITKDGLFKPTTYQLGRKNKIVGTIDEKIEEVSAPYRELKSISEDVAKEVELSKAGKLTNPKYVTASVTPEGVEAMLNAKRVFDDIRDIRFRRKALAQKAAAGDPEAAQGMRLLIAEEGVLESRLDAAAIAAGQKDLVDRLAAARQKIAVLKAIDESTTTFGTVDPAVLSALRGAGAPLSGNLEKIALFNDAFKASSREISQAGPVQGAGVSTAYIGRNVLAGNPMGATAAGVPVLSQAARDFLLAQRQQNRATQIMPQQLADNPQAAFARQASMLGSLNIGDSEQTAQRAATLEQLRSVRGY